MSWLHETSRALSGQAFLTHVEDTIYRRCEGQPRRPARDDAYWTRRARAVIGQAGLGWRLRANCSEPVSGRRVGHSETAAHPNPIDRADDPEILAPVMGTDETTPGGASEHGATSFLNSCCEC